MELTLAAGTILNERYKITRLISADSLGGIYEVLDTKVTEQAYVAREFFPTHADAGERAVKEKQFGEIAQILQTLEHPGLMRVFNSFTEGNRFYLITEKIDGLSLEALVKLTSSPMSEAEALTWLVQLCETLSYLHHHSPPLYMKDLNPSVIMINRDGRLKLGGFGISRLLGPADALPKEFIAPELHGGETGSAAADIYGMAATGYFLLTRQPPKPSPEPAQKFNPAVSENTSKLLLACLRPEPELRPTDLQKLEFAFDEILHPPQVRPAPVQSPKFRRITEPLKKLAKNIILGGVALGQRPYLIVLLALLFWIAHLNLRHISLIRFQKNGPLLYVLCKSKIVVVDPAALKIVDDIPGIEDAFAISAAGEGDHPWLATQKGSLIQMNPQDDTVVSQFSLGQQIRGISLAKRNRILVTLDRDNTLGIYAASTGKPIAFSPTQQLPKDVAYNRHEDEIYVTTSSSKTLTVLDANKYIPKQTITLDFIPAEMVLSPDENYIYAVSKDSSRLMIVDANSKDRLGEISLPVPGPYSLSAYDHGILVTAPKENGIFVYDYPGGTEKCRIYLNKPVTALYVTALGKIFALTSNGYLYAADPATGKIIRHLRLGGSPLSALFIP